MGNFVLLVPYLDKYISRLFLSIEFSGIKRIFPIESVKFSFTHYEHSTVEDLEIQVMSLILQQTGSEQTSLSKHSSVTLIEARSSATNSNIQKSTGKIRILPFTKATFSLVHHSLNFLSPILIHFFFHNILKLFLNVMFLQNIIYPFLTVVIPGMSVASALSHLHSCHWISRLRVTSFPFK